MIALFDIVQNISHYYINQAHFIFLIHLEFCKIFFEISFFSLKAISEKERPFSHIDANRPQKVSSLFFFFAKK